MGMTAADYLKQLQGLLPHGPAWPKESDSEITRLLAGWSEELARIDARAIQLIEESDPRTTFELLSDWERVAGLPDTCVVALTDTQSTDQRRSALVGRLASLGGQSIAYFVSLAASLGFAVTITEFHEHSVSDDVEHPMYGPAWNFAWQVNAALNTVTEITVESDVSEAIASWGNAILECVFNRLKPAHTTILYSYT